MKKKLFLIITFLFSVLFIGRIEAASGAQSCSNWDNFDANDITVYFYSGFANSTKAKNAGLTADQVKHLSFPTTTDGKQFQRSKGSDYYNGLAASNELKIAYMLTGLNDVTVDNVEYSFGGWYYDAEFKTKVTVETAYDLSLQNSRSLGKWNCLARTAGKENYSSNSEFYKSDSAIMLYAKWDLKSGTKPTCDSITYDKRKNHYHQYTTECSSVAGTTTSCTMDYNPGLYMASTNSSYVTIPNLTTYTRRGYLKDLSLSDNTLEIPANDVVDGYKFEGWYYDRYFTEPIPAGTKLKDLVKWIPNRIDVHGCADSWADIIVYPKWVWVEEQNENPETISIKLYNTYDTNISSFTKKMISGATTANLPVPSRSGYVFEGWYYDGKFQEKVNGMNENDIDVSKLRYVTPYSGSANRTYILFAKWARKYYSNGVEVSGINNSLHDFASLSVNSVNVDSGILSSKNIDSQKYVAYNITIEKTITGEHNQPDGDVRVGIVIPNKISDLSKLKAFYLDGTNLVEYPVQVGDDGYAYFVTDHFSTYLIGQSTGSSNPDPDPTNTTADLQNIIAKTSSGSALALSPNFSNSYTGVYSIGNVDSSVDKILFTFTKSDVNQVVTVNGINSNECILAYGENECLVTSANGNSARTYKINVYRNKYVEPLDLEAEITKIVYNGNDYFPNSNYQFVIDGIAPSKSSINVLAYAAEGSTINGNKVGSLGYISTVFDLPLSLPQVSNELNVLSPSASNAKTYTLVVNRRSVGTDATLSKLEAYLSGGNINLIGNKFSPSTLNYSVNVAADSTQLVLDYETNDSNARVNNSNKGTINCSISKTSPTCTIKVVAEDGNNSKIYTVNAVYPEVTANTDSTLKSLTISEPDGIQFTFKSNSDDQGSINVPYEVRSIKFNPVLNVSDPNKAWIDQNSSNYNPCTLNIGDTICKIVTDSEGKLSHTYTVKVTRAPQSQPVDESDTLPVNICLDNDCSTIRSQVAYVTDYENKVDGHPTYVANVGSDVSKVIFKLNGHVSNTEFASDAVTTCDLAVGSTTCPVKINKAGTVRTYVIKITRANPDVELSDDARLARFEIDPSSLSLVETFNMDKEGIYHILAEHSVEAIKFKNYKTYLDDASVLEAESNLYCPLVDGTNECVITVLAPNGTTKKRYYFLIERSATEDKPSVDDIVPFNVCTKASCNDNSLLIYKKITGDDGSIYYQSEVEYDVAEVFAVISDATSNLTISGDGVCKLNDVGVNDCKFVVLGDGVEKTYNFKITRKAAPENPSPNPDVDPCEADPNSKECKQQICTKDPSKCDTTDTTDTGAFALGTIAGLAVLVGIVFILKSKFGSKIYKI